MGDGSDLAGRLLGAGLLEPQDLAPGLPERIGRYDVVAPLGQGAASSVYKAWDQELERWVAIKLLTRATSATTGARFDQERAILATLRHPNVVRLLDGGFHVGQPYLVLELMTGRSLAEARLPRGELLRALVQVCLGCHAAHELGIVHHDLKPANILLGDRPAIADFGVARVADAPGRTQAGALVGTLHYMAPEQVGGVRGDRRSDVYALGAILYEQLTGRSPYGQDEETPMELLARILEGNPEPPRALDPTIPAALEAVVLRAMAGDPAARYATAQELATALSAVAREAPRRSAPAPAPVAPAAGGSTGRPLVVAGLVVAGLLVALVMAVKGAPVGSDWVALRHAAEDSRRVDEPPVARRAKPSAPPRPIAVVVPVPTSEAPAPPDPGPGPIAPEVAPVGSSLAERLAAWERSAPDARAADREAEALREALGREPHPRTLLARLQRALGAGELARFLLPRGDTPEGDAVAGLERVRLDLEALAVERTLGGGLDAAGLLAAEKELQASLAAGALPGGLPDPRDALVRALARQEVRTHCVFCAVAGAWVALGRGELPQVWTGESPRGAAREVALVRALDACSRSAQGGAASPEQGALAITQALVAARAGPADEVTPWRVVCHVYMRGITRRSRFLNALPHQEVRTGSSRLAGPWPALAFVLATCAARVPEADAARAALARASSLEGSSATPWVAGAYLAAATGQPPGPSLDTAVARGLLDSVKARELVDALGRVPALGTR